MTAHDSEVVRAQAQALGALAFLTKPVAEPTLLAALRSALSPETGRLLQPL